MIGNELMLEYYIFKYYFNAGHSVDNDIHHQHNHTFQISLYIGIKDVKGQYLFNEMDEHIHSYLSQYEGQFLNDMEVFQGIGTNIEDIGDVFYDELKEQLGLLGFRLYQLEISENPLCVYIVSNRILLQTRSEKGSRREIETVLERKKRLLDMMNHEGGN